MAHPQREALLQGIWQPPREWKQPGAWLWWFWLFFIHDEGTQKTGKCRQLMILWSIKNDASIRCNSLGISIPKQLESRVDGTFRLNGAAAAWYFDGESMHHDFVLEKSHMELDPLRRSLFAPGTTPSSFSQQGDDFITKIRSGSREFEFVARQEDLREPVGPAYGRTPLPAGMEIEGTRVERLALSGTELHNGAKREIKGTAYFQKILLACPPPQWYWGLYHFPEGSFFTYMLPYAGRAALAGNLMPRAGLKKPTLPLQQDIYLFHAPTGRVFEGKSLSVAPSRIEGTDNWLHEIKGGGKGFSINAAARAYSHSCWSFEKKIGILPAKSRFFYNEYPSVLERLELRTESGETLLLENGWGNMENAWGFLI